MISKELKLYMRADSSNDDGFVYYVDDSEHSNHWPRDEDIHIGEVSVHFNPPGDLNEDELRKKAINTLRDKQSRVRAEAERTIQQLEEKIKTMMLLTFQPESDVIEQETP